MFNIRLATEHDIPAISDIAEKTWWPTYSPFLSAEQIRFMLATIYAPETLTKDIRSGSQTFLLLTDSDGPKGFASYGRRSDDAQVFKLHKLYVLPDQHQKGYGNALVSEVKKRLLKENIHLLDLNVNRYNPARTFYEKIGFTILREEDIPIGPYWMNDFVMRIQF